MKVKICGITNLEDALNAVRFGADELGFNFYPESPRYITPSDAAVIARELPSYVETLGVFVNEKFDRILTAAGRAGLSGLQLHGDETRKFVSELRARTQLKIVKAIRVGPEFGAADALGYEADSVLLDSLSAVARGGTGKSYDWDIAASVNALVNSLYLAGGLTPVNIAAAVMAVRPYAVDVASGVESEPGLKDPAKLEAFIRYAKNA